MGADKLFTDYNQLTWIWNGQKQKLGNMTDKQLYYLIDLLKRNPSKNWFSIPSNTWLNNINYILAKRKLIKQKALKTNILV